MNSITLLALLFLGIVLSPVLAQTRCGSVRVCLIRQTAGNYRVNLNLNVETSFTGVLTSVKASGYYFNFEAMTNGVMTTPSSAPNLNGMAGSYSDRWAEEIGFGDVQVAFPYIRAFGIKQFCYGSFPAVDLELLETGNRRKCFRQSMYKQEGIDLALVVDSTGSMSDDIEDVKKNASGIVDWVFGNSPNPRVGIVEYNDPTASVVLPLSSDKSAILTSINSLNASGGGDFPEHVYSGLKLALGLDWGFASNRMMVTFGDAPAKDPEPGSGLTLSSILSLSNFIGTPVDTTPSVRMLSETVRQAEPVVIDVPVESLNPFYMVPVGTSGTTTDSFTELAEGSGGGVFPAADADEVVPAILEALEAALPSDPAGPTEDPTLERICMSEEDAMLKFRITNPNDFPVPYVWRVIPGNEEGAGNAVAGVSYIMAEKPDGDTSVVLTFSWLKKETGQFGTEVFAAASCVDDLTS